MTYNFDPDRWYENELAALEREREAGCLNRSDYEKCKDQLMDRYDAMMQRLDGTFEIPKQ
jgi:N12 class adenine-specific DNA methylase